MNIWESLAKEEKAYWSNKNETLRFWRHVSAGRPFIVFDVETTGLKKAADRIIEFSAIRMEKVARIYRKTDELEVFIKPPFAMDPRVIEIHGITDEFLADKPEEPEAYGMIRDFFTEDAVVMGYNVNFDISFTDAMFKRNGDVFRPESIDVFKLVKENIFTDEHENKRELSEITHLLFPDKDFRFHDSTEDIFATWEVGTEILKRYVRSSPVPESSKPKGKIIRYSTKRYGKWKGIFVTVAADGKYHDLYYDVMRSCWVQKYNMIPIFAGIDMDDIEKQMNELAQIKGKSHFHLLNDSWKKGKENV